MKLVRDINVKLRSLDFYLLDIVESMRVSIQGRAKQNISEDKAWPAICSFWSKGHCRGREQQGK